MMNFCKFMCGSFISLALLGACTDPGEDILEPDAYIESLKDKDPSLGAIKALALTSASDVAVFGDYLLVADCGYSAMESPLPYKEGRVAVLDRKTYELKKWLKTSALNPSWITVVGQKAYVVSSGAVDFDTTKNIAYAASDGAIDILELSDITKWAASMALPRNEEDPRLGDFGRLAVTSDGKTGFMGSGTTNAIFEVDLKNNTIVRGTDNPIDLEDLPRENSGNGFTSLRMFNDVLYVAAFNNDAVCVADAVSDHLAEAICGGIGLQDALLEGPIDLVLDYNNIDLIVAMSVANATYYVEFDKNHATFKTINNGSTGSSPNAIARNNSKNKPYVYVVNSMNSSISRQNISSKETTKSWAVMPANSNPVQMALDNEDGRIFVSLAGSGHVAVVSLDSGKVIGYAYTK